MINLTQAKKPQFQRLTAIFAYENYARTVHYPEYHRIRDRCRGGGKKPAIVEAIDLDIGELAGIEIDSIEFLWDAAVEGTVLSGRQRRIRRVAGRALCSACQKEFTLKSL